VAAAEKALVFLPAGRADEDVEFQRRCAAEITRLYPGCPTARAAAIAQHRTRIKPAIDRVLAAWSAADAR
jgi:hypothetical protein